MNLCGSYTKLLNNSKQAMYAAIEIYNKPKFDYKEEVFVILLVNAWELLNLAILSKNKQTIYQKKQRGSNYQTLNFDVAFEHCTKYLPDAIKKDTEAIKLNLVKIKKYRNNSIHFYNDKKMPHVIYALSQPAITNYVDIVQTVFHENIIQEINIILLPLSFNNPPNIFRFISKEKNKNPFMTELINDFNQLQRKNCDTTKFMTKLSIGLEKINKKENSDLIAQHSLDSDTVVTKNINPDDSHPFFMYDIIGNKKRAQHLKLKKCITSHEFQSITYKHKIKENEKYCWKSNKGGSPRYSQQIINFLNDLTKEDINLAKIEYKNRKIK